MGDAPAWHTTIFPPYFVAGAIYSGFALVLPLEALAVRLLGAVRPGTYPLYGWTSLAVFIKERLLESAGNYLSGTLLWPQWLRWAGMHVGRKCEVSTIMEVIPELVEIGKYNAGQKVVFWGMALLIIVLMIARPQGLFRWKAKKAAA